MSTALHLVEEKRTNEEMEDSTLKRRKRHWVCVKPKKQMPGITEALSEAKTAEKTRWKRRRRRNRGALRTQNQCPRGQKGSRMYFKQP